MGDQQAVSAKDFEEAVNKIIKKITELTTKITSIDNEVAILRQDHGRLTVSVNNVQTQQLELRGKFSEKKPGDSSVSPPPPPPSSATHKLRFPRYDGTEDPLGWLHKCDQFFRSQGTPDDQKVWVASFYMEGAASQWYYRLEKNRDGPPTWPQLVEAVNKRFGPLVRSNPFGELTHLRCTAMQIDIEMQNPESLEDAMALARSFERRGQVNDDPSSSQPRAPPHSHPSLPSPASVRTPAPVSKAASTVGTPGAPMKPPAGSRFTRLSTEEMAQRRLDGLCYNCPEKFSRDHLKHCTMKGIYLLEVADDPSQEETTAEDDVEISLHALTGVSTGRTLKLPVKYGAITNTALVDSGSTHSFMATATAHRLGLTPAARPGLTIGVDNGDCIPSTGVCSNTRITIGEESFDIDLYVIPLDGYELVLGCDWLRTLGPILWDFEQLRMTFWRHDHQVRWRGVNTTGPPCSLQPPTAIYLGPYWMTCCSLQRAYGFAASTGIRSSHSPHA
ncbi:hypothetical protein BS78_01G295900 [Paspalum vaginatum]|nr:hypothetical protein BS78_01G295900 [Paspalum vaginatum]